MNIETIINQCEVVGNVIKLPPTQLNRAVYLDVKKKLEKIGGKWNIKQQGFVFDYNPSDLLADLQGGKDRNIKKEFQFFETPQVLAKRLIVLAQIENYYCDVLEPSAGQGAIVREIPRGCPVYMYEINPLFHENLRTFHNADLRGNDFLEADESIKYSRIVANPPFSKNQDIDHIRKMYAVLADGGILVSVASTHWRHSNNRKETEFRQWLEDVGAESHEVEPGAFKESGTNIPTVIVVINK